MNYVHSIRFWRANGELLPEGAFSRVALSSVDTRWNDVVVEQHDFTSSELTDVMFKQHVIVINNSHSIAGEQKKERRCQHGGGAPDTICFFPSNRPFSLRLKVERGLVAKALLLALDPVFVRRIAEGPELNAHRIELVPQRLGTDPALYQIAMALRTGVLTGAALDRMYGEALSTALAVHLLRDFGAAVLGPERECRGLPRKKADACPGIHSISNERRLNGS
jgi:AraC family transcriptional regulator